ncbi:MULTISPECIES: alpha/beta hydrolase family protein [unclassified Agarivorans]|nr:MULTISPECIES: alpha/beta fold hydrolase [unclassified Agarivorans]MDO6686188.1 alpha/beta fold hydrolase [Agarivorans sp. 3_MG-2023]MDO6716363.1 alpha/beta fold hydrolase [Agarivorans sp. 2_MG-2023]
MHARILTWGLVLLSSCCIAEDNGETLWIPMTDPGLLWDSEIRLEATLYKPIGEGPFPLVVFNHGSTGPGIIAKGVSIKPWSLGAYLTKHNIALLVPMRRGRGNSEGEYKESYNCSVNSVEAGLRYAQQSLDATFAFIKQQTWVDQDKILISGNSRGGLLSVMYAAKHPSLFKGVVNFSGGWMGEQCQINAESASNLGLFAQAAQNNPLPHLFIYGRNDAYYSDSTIQSYVNAFTEHSPQIEFQFYQLGDGINGHEVFYNYGDLWLYGFNQFLKQTGMLK